MERHGKTDMDDTWMTVRIDGVVQGVGFRPAVYRVATEMGLTGTVENSLDGVHIRVRASAVKVEGMIERIRKHLPPAARIDSVTVMPSFPPESEYSEGFKIIHSSESDGKVTDVSPDIAICKECLGDILRHPRRIGYPMTNCTRCGPRFTIIKDLPYDRRNTSMGVFDMCDDCRREYTDPLDRRFHAQPVACNNCGPVYSACIGEDRITDYMTIVNRCAEAIEGGEIILCKSLGGYNLMCDATNGLTVKRLRSLKHRPRKPFAVMVKDVTDAEALVRLNMCERESLKSWRAPIVVAETCFRDMLPPSVAPGCVTLGVMLPYMAFQHHLLERLRRPVVVTSANLPGQPIMTDDTVAHDYGKSNNLPVVSFNREIVNRVDDSVVRYCGGDMRILRRSRGYVPSPLPFSADCSDILAMGADITSAWAFGRGTDIIQSQYIGSLTGEGGERALRESLETLMRLYRCTPRIIVTDAHPAYRSTAIGHELAARFGIRCVNVMHHHAHVAGVMAEYGVTSPVLALVLDGTGYGTDGTIWGCELLRCSLTDFTRLDHGPGMPLPGGDAAAIEPWRMAVSFVKTFFGDLSRLPSGLVSAIGERRIAVLSQMIDKGINSPVSFGAGRMWDAVAALLGVALVNGYESEAPVLLENLALTSPAVTSDSGLALAQDFTVLARELMAQIDRGCDSAIIARDFHTGYASCLTELVRRHLTDDSPSIIILSGGVVQNALMTEILRTRLEALGLTVLVPCRVPCGDGGIAAGQIAVAASLYTSSI